MRSASRTGDPRNISISKTCPAADCDLIGSNKPRPHKRPRGSPAKSRTSWIHNNGQQVRCRREAGLQLESATAGIEVLSAGFAGPSSASRLPLTTHRNSRSLSAGRSRRNISAANTTAFSRNHPPTMMLKADIGISPLMPRRAQRLISARRNHTRINCSFYGAL